MVFYDESLSLSLMRSFLRVFANFYIHLEKNSLVEKNEQAPVAVA